MTYEYFYTDDCYESLVASAGEIVGAWNIGDWQGDEVYLLKNGDQYGFIVVGYGSCSGCDALQACENQEEVDELKQSIVDEIVWGSKEYIYDYIFSVEANRWYFHEDQWDEIKDELKTLLK